MNNQQYYNHKPAVIWLTGLSGSGKTTIANQLMDDFKSKLIKPVLLDGDEIRQSLKQNGFDYAARKAHNLSVGALASLFEKQDHVVIVALISPYEEFRNEVRNICKNFIEVFVSANVDICIQRDPKGLYKKALAGEIPDFTGVSAPYFPPVNPEVIVDTATTFPKDCANKIIDFYLQF